MKKVVSFRLDETAAGALRRRAARREIGFTRYIEGLVLSDLEDSGPRGPAALRILRALREHRAALERLGIRHAALFGSVARGEDRPDSDVDLLLTIDRGIIRDLFDYGRAAAALEDLLGRPVDVAREDRLRPNLAAEVARDRIDAF